MKKMLVLILFVFEYLFSQTPPPCTVVIVPGECQVSARGADYYNLSSLSVVEIPISLHIVRATNGTGGVDANNVSTMLSNINNAFSGAKMHFFIYSLNEIRCHYTAWNV